MEEITKEAYEEAMTPFQRLDRLSTKLLPGTFEHNEMCYDVCLSLMNDWPKVKDEIERLEKENKSLREILGMVEGKAKEDEIRTEAVRMKEERAIREAMILLEGIL